MHCDGAPTSREWWVDKSVKLPDLIKILVGGPCTEEVVRRVLTWPPDAFAIAATLLRDSGAYLAVAHQWPSPRFRSQAEWAGQMKEIGHEWREVIQQNLPDVPTADSLRSQTPSSIGEQVLINETPAEPLCPPQILEWWNTVLGAEITLAMLEQEALGAADARPVTDALMQIVAAADEACFGIGATPPFSRPAGLDEEPTSVERMQFAGARKLLRDVTLDEAATLCLTVVREAAIVLPKTRTPQTGMTIRCLTHNLALLRGSEVKTDWIVVSSEPPAIGQEQACLTLLLVPWPAEVYPNQFRTVPPTGTEPYHGSPRIGLFHFLHDEDQRIENARVDYLLKSAVRQIGRVDGVIFPELSITEEEFDLVRRMLGSRDPAKTPARFILAGVHRAAIDGAYGVNKVIFEYTVDTTAEKNGQYRRDQHKHHRWHLDEGQVRQYGLGAQLDPRRLWVEHIRLAERRVEFLNLDNKLLMCSLICEDLAQSDPIAETIRSVGPNLLICLLADGPQLTSRWPSRYATTLADDPGCSVLTLTSRGMSRLSQPRDGEVNRRDVIALWKEASGTAREITLEQGCGAVAISLSIHTEEQLTADHRTDGGTTRCVTLSGVRQIANKHSTLHP